MTRRIRLDKELVRRGLVDSIDDVAGLIDDKRVLVAGSTALSTAHMISPAEPLHVVGPAEKYVGRGGKKLEAALVGFDIDPTGKTALDLGASTGGFTDALLQAGARQVVAVDVGRGQLHQRLLADDRVDSHEQTDLRDLDPEKIGQFALITADLSFISLRAVASELLALADEHADLILLVKPQFEAERSEVDAGHGVISDSSIWKRTLVDVISTMSDNRATTMGAMVSPIRGAEGNVEFLVWLRRGGATRPVDIDALVEGVPS